MDLFSEATSEGGANEEEQMRQLWLKAQKGLKAWAYFMAYKWMGETLPQEDAAAGGVVPQEDAAAAAGGRCRRETPPQEAADRAIWEKVGEKLNSDPVLRDVLENLDLLRTHHLRTVHLKNQNNRSFGSTGVAAEDFTNVFRNEETVIDTLQYDFPEAESNAAVLLNELKEEVKTARAVNSGAQSSGDPTGTSADSNTEEAKPTEEATPTEATKKESSQERKRKAETEMEEVWAQVTNAD